MKRIFRLTADHWTIVVGALFVLFMIAQVAAEFVL